MILDIKSIFFDSYTKIFEGNFDLIALIFALAVAVFVLRYDIGYHLNLTQKGENKLAEKSLLTMLIIGASTAFYFYVKEYYFLLLIIPSFILTYFLYQIGFFDIVIEKCEDKNGRW